MNEQNKRITNILQEWGYRIIKKDDFHIIFRFQLNDVVCLFDADDVNFYSVGMSNFFEYENKNEQAVLKHCNELNKIKKMVKAYTLYGNRIMASAEFYCYNTKDLPRMLKTALESLLSAKMYFTEVPQNNFE